MTRRRFLQLAAGAGAFASAMGRRAFAAVAPAGSIQYRTLGRTGAKVSIVGIGGWHLSAPGGPSESESIAIVRTGIDNGINFLDNSWDYNGGESERRMGLALRDGYRDRAFLMTKADGRTKVMLLAQLDQSLKRLQTDHVDLLQIHEVIRDSDPNRVFGADGAIEGLIEARKAGKIRFIGFTGHKSPEIHLKMLNTAFAHGFTFDAVQMPLNVMDAHYDSFENKVLPVLREHNIGAIAMKPFGDNFILQSGTVSATEALHYSMSLPVAVVITGCDYMKWLRQALDAARSFRPLSPTELAALLARTRDAAADGRFELYKTREVFDGTSRNPQWLG